MGTLIFDVDSTLLSIETLERILTTKLSPDKFIRFRAITEKGLKGEIPFPESLKVRLELAKPSKNDLIAFSDTLPSYITKGAKELISELKAQNHQIWLLSGGLKESLAPLPGIFGIPESRLVAVVPLWSDNGEFVGLDPNDQNSISKALGARPFVKEWQRPAWMIGDSVSDYSLLREGLVDDFILYTEHFQCSPLQALGLKETENMEALRRRLEDGGFLLKK